MATFEIVREIVSASGTQTFQVDADSVQDALEKFQNGESSIVNDDCEVTELADFDLDDIYQVIKFKTIISTY